MEGYEKRCFCNETNDFQLRAPLEINDFPARNADAKRSAPKLEISYFLKGFGLRNEPRKRYRTESVLRRYMETARKSAETNGPHDFWTTKLATQMIRSS